MFKKKVLNKNIRKRERESGSENEADDTQIIRKDRKKMGVLAGSTLTKKSGEDENNMIVTFDASGSAASIVKDTATRTLDIDGADDLKEGDIITPEDPDDLETYKGMNKYAEFINKKTEKVSQSNASRIRAGPLKGPTNVRISCRFDYQPDICKDYKETGYCGYGDSCKFMHDRGDYKAGWQIDQEWDKDQKLLADGKSLDNDDDKWLIKEGEDAGEDSDEDLPFACLYCRKDFKFPVVTKCGHYFCEACAIKCHAKSPKCFTCGQPTGGVFNTAKDLKEKLENKRRRIEEKEREIQAQVGNQAEEESENEADEV